MAQVMLFEILQRPIAFHPVLAEIAGSAKAGIILSQAMYWAKVSDRDDHSFYKTREEWMKETTLTKREYDNAMASLKELGFIETEQADSFDRTNWFRVNHEKVLDAIATKGDHPSPQNVAIHRHERGQCIATKRGNGTIYTETTTETTQRFRKPTIEECKDYAKKQGLNPSEGEKFWNYHDSRGWIVGKSPMKNWHSAFGTWKCNLKKWPTKECEPAAASWQDAIEGVR